MANLNDSINVSIFTALKVSEMSKVPVLIMSNPGLGKSTTVELFAKVRGYKLILLRGNSTTSEEIMGYDVANDNPEAKTTIHLRPSWYTKILKHSETGGKTLLFLDEITTANEYVQASLLHLVFERKVGDEELPEDTLIVSAGNYAQNLSNSMQMLPPLMNRFMIFNITPTHKDLDTFLCKYEGAIASKDGKVNDFMKALEKVMVKLDSQEMKDLTEGQINKIGEYIERGIKMTTRSLMTSGAKVLDMSITDLQGLYADAENETKLYGFATFRTLNKLRDVTLASYLCFGKAGITSDNYRNMVDGLCGIGLSRDPKSKNVVKTIISSEYYNCMLTIVNDIEKMKNSALPRYTQFFVDIIGEGDVDKKRFDMPQIQAVTNKVKEMERDKELSNIERPIDPSFVKSILRILRNSGVNLMKVRLDSGGKITQNISTEDLISAVTTWNSIVDSVVSIGGVISDPKRGYKDDVSNYLTNIKDDLSTSGYRLRMIRKSMSNVDPSIVNIVPEVRSY